MRQIVVGGVSYMWKAYHFTEEAFSKLPFSGILYGRIQRFSKKQKIRGSARSNFSAFAYNGIDGGIVPDPPYEERMGIQEKA